MDSKKLMDNEDPNDYKKLSPTKEVYEAISVAKL